MILICVRKHVIWSLNITTTYANATHGRTIVKGTAPTNSRKLTDAHQDALEIKSLIHHLEQEKLINLVSAAPNGVEKDSVTDAYTLTRDPFMKF